MEQDKVQCKPNERQQDAVKVMPVNNHPCKVAGQGKSQQPEQAALPQGDKGMQHPKK